MYENLSKAEFLEIEGKDVDSMELGGDEFFYSGKIVESAPFISRVTGDTIIHKDIRNSKNDEILGTSIIWNQLVDHSAAEETVCLEIPAGHFYIREGKIYQSGGEALTVRKEENIHDLTLMFGERILEFLKVGNLTGLVNKKLAARRFKTLFPLSSYTYETGRVLSTNLTAESKIVCYSKVHYLIPDEYIQLEYIQSNGSQWLDTRFTASKSGVFVLTADMTSGATGTSIHAQYGGAKTIFSVSGYEHQGTDMNIVYNEDALKDPIHAPLGKHTYVIDYYNRRAGYDGNYTPFAHKVTKFSGELPFLIGAWYEGGTAHYRASGKFYSFKVYNEDNLLLYLIPAKEKTGAKRAGMYDLVREQFYASVSGTDFTPGPEIEDPEPVIEKEEFPLPHYFTGGDIELRGITADVYDEIIGRRIIRRTKKILMTSIGWTQNEPGIFRGDLYSVGFKTAGKIISSKFTGLEVSGKYVEISFPGSMSDFMSYIEGAEFVLELETEYEETQKTTTWERKFKDFEGGSEILMPLNSGTPYTAPINLVNRYTYKKPNVILQDKSGYILQDLGGKGILSN